MIQYEVDENSKTVKCILTRNYSLDDIIKKNLKKMGNANFDITLKDSQLSKAYVGIAKHHPEDANEFSILIGKEIARKKAFARYYDDMKKSTLEVINDLNVLQDRLRFNFFSYDSTQRDIFNTLEKY